MVIKELKIGRKAASVFPVPVGATKRIFFSSSIGGMALIWGSVGAGKPLSKMALRMGFAKRLKASPF